MTFPQVSKHQFTSEPACTRLSCGIIGLLPYTGTALPEAKFRYTIGDKIKEQ